MKVTVTKEVEVDISTLCSKELLKLDKQVLADALIEAHALLGGVQAVETVKATPSMDEYRTTATTTTKSVKRAIGKKIGNTSKYHYVFWSSTQNKWVGRVKADDKVNHVGTFHNEIECAKAVDICLDKIKDSRRPRNRDEFKEVSAWVA